MAPARPRAEGVPDQQCRGAKSSPPAPVFARVVDSVEKIHIEKNNKCDKARYPDGFRMAAVEIYTIRYCPYCQDAKDLLSRKGVAFHEIDASGNREIRRQMIARANGRNTFPQVFVGSTHVGGCDDLYALEAAGKLDALLAVGRATAKEAPA
jgi:glutaredoxin 3